MRASVEIQQQCEQVTEMTLECKGQTTHALLQILQRLHREKQQLPQLPQAAMPDSEARLRCLESDG